MTAKNFSLVALLILCVALNTACAQQESAPGRSAKPPHVLSIRYGWFSGMCYGYCSEELNVSTGDAVLMKTASSEKSKYRDLRVAGNVSPKHWRELAQLADYQNFDGVPERIGCPGCVDEPVEYIEVRYSDRTTKSVTYNAGGAPVPLATLAEKLSALIAKLEKDIPRSMMPRP
jgi:hypothetical protein